MNLLLLIAGILCILLGLAHSVLGEIMVFKDKRDDNGFIPSTPELDINRKHFGIVWATWHLATLFGIAIGMILIRIAYIQIEPTVNEMDVVVESTLISAIVQPLKFIILVAAFLVYLGTKGRHPGWFVLFLISVLLFAS